MKFSRRSFQSLMLGAVALPFAGALAWGDDYPNHPVRLIVGFPAGSGPDIVGRIIGQGLSEKLGQSVVVENRPGAGSNLATSDVAHASPDGYMLMLLTTANVINATLYTNLNYDLLRDIAPIGSIDNEPFVLVVNPSVPAKTMPEFIAYAKAKPGQDHDVVRRHRQRTAYFWRDVAETWREFSSPTCPIAAIRCPI